MSKKSSFKNFMTNDWGRSMKKLNVKVTAQKVWHFGLNTVSFIRNIPRFVLGMAVWFIGGVVAYGLILGPEESFVDSWIKRDGLELSTRAQQGMVNFVTSMLPYLYAESSVLERVEYAPSYDVNTRIAQAKALVQNAHAKSGTQQHSQQSLPGQQSQSQPSWQAQQLVPSTVSPQIEQAPGAIKQEPSDLGEQVYLAFNLRQPEENIALLEASKDQVDFAAPAVTLTIPEYVRPLASIIPESAATSLAQEAAASAQVNAPSFKLGSGLGSNSSLDLNQKLNQALTLSPNHNQSQLLNYPSAYPSGQVAQSNVQDKAYVNAQVLPYSPQAQIQSQAQTYAQSPSAQASVAQAVSIPATEGADPHSVASRFAFLQRSQPKVMAAALVPVKNEDVALSPSAQTLLSTQSTQQPTTLPASPATTPAPTASAFTALPAMTTTPTVDPLLEEELLPFVYAGSEHDRAERFQRGLRNPPKRRVDVGAFINSLRPDQVNQTDQPGDQADLAGQNSKEPIILGTSFHQTQLMCDRWPAYKQSAPPEAIGGNIKGQDNKAMAIQVKPMAPNHKFTALPVRTAVSPQVSLQFVQTLKQDLCRQGVCEEDYADKPEVYHDLFWEAYLGWYLTHRQEVSEGYQIKTRAPTQQPALQPQIQAQAQTSPQPQPQHHVQDMGTAQTSSKASTQAAVPAAAPSSVQTSANEHKTPGLAQALLKVKPPQMQTLSAHKTEAMALAQVPSLTSGQEPRQPQLLT